jgi:hypothetical protein
MIGMKQFFLLNGAGCRWSAQDAWVVSAVLQGAEFVGPHGVLAG